MRVDARGKFIFGVGINDSDYKVSTKINGRTVWVCPFYQKWKSMFDRCYNKKQLSRRPSYNGCEVCEEWKKFSVFRVWMMEQPWQGNQLDKDILTAGNKIYSPDKCVFITRMLNGFLTEEKSDKGDWPTGVSWDSRDNKYQARCWNPFSLARESLGCFDSSDLAHHAWRVAKHGHALRYADMQTDPRIAQALRTRYLVDKELN